MSCTLEKVLGDARTLLERLKEHDTAAEGLIEQSGALSQRVHNMREVGNAFPDKVRTRKRGFIQLHRVLGCAAVYTHYRLIKVRRTPDKSTKMFNLRTPHFNPIKILNQTPLTDNFEKMNRGYLYKQCVRLL